MTLSGFTIKNSNKNSSKVINNLKKYDNQIKLLYRSSFISLLSTVEWFFSQILHQYYNNYPKAAGISQKTLTLEDLKGFENVRDAENYLIENKIEDILRSSFDNWIEILKKELKRKHPINTI